MLFVAVAITLGQQITSGPVLARLQGLILT
jgi:hypothetical protein